MREPSANFQETKNDPTNQPLWLFRVNISDTPEVTGEDDLFLANAEADVTYFRTDAGEHSEQVYEAAGVRLGGNGITQNSDGRIDSLTVSLQNVKREVSAYVEQRDGLRGRKVTVRQVFREHLSDPDAYIEDVYYIDAVNKIDARTAEFRLSSKLDVLSIPFPRRHYMRNFCQNIYKKCGCWVSDGEGGYTEPTGFSSTEQVLFAGEIAGNSGSPSDAAAKFFPVSARGLTLATDSLKIELKVSDASKVTSNSQIEIASGGTHDDHELNYSDLSGLGLTTDWQEFTLAFSAFSATGGTIDLSAINYIRAYMYASSGNIQIFWRNARVVVNKAHAWTTDKDFCTKTFADCRRHNNTARFGGFPNIPDRRHFRG